MMRPRAGAAGAAGGSWMGVAERGSLLGIWTMVAICRLCGRRLARLLLRPIVLYFVALAALARRSSRAYLRRIGQPHDFWSVYAHCLCFAHCTLDRLFWVLGRHQLFEITTTGSEHLAALTRARRGALLFGAHLGSFEAMLGVARREAVPLNIVGYFKNARLINGVLERLNPALRARLISVEPGIDFVLRLKERIDGGELVAVLADRVGLGERAAEVQFLGGPVLFPSGPYLLAAALRCPVYLTFGLYREPNRYDLYCEPFAERIELPRATRDAAARIYVQRFADRLEHYCRLAADNWFNFYDYWQVGA
jgi:predicted LPLAT superfamily acyltransferase